ncbi:MAG: amidase [Bryobacteraceae bacterium]
MTLLAAQPAGDIASLTLVEAAAAVRRKKLSPVELTKACLDRIARLNPSLNAFITISADQALAEAHRLERERPRGPIHGVPIALKDLIDTAGTRTTAASHIYADRVPDQDAEVVRRLRLAGAVILGKVNMDEFAYNFTSETSYFGAAHNPWNPKMTPGGSSGGSAVAVAARMCFGALGSDTGGSIRLPASFCGIAGFKPSYGLVPATGVLPLAWSMDHVGPMCRTVADTALLLGAMTGAGDRFAIGRRPARLRVGVARKFFFDGLDPEVASAMNAALDAMKGLGMEVREVELPDIPSLPIIRAEALAWHEPLMKKHLAGYHPHTLHEIREGERVTVGEYARALRELERLRLAVRRTFNEVDAVVTPTSPLPPFPLGTKPDLVYLRNTIPFNVFGLPAISIPCGFTGTGMPIGLQVSAAPQAEAAVLVVAHAYEQATEWHRKSPRV